MLGTDDDEEPSRLIIATKRHHSDVDYQLRDQGEVGARNVYGVLDTALLQLGSWEGGGDPRLW